MRKYQLLFEETAEDESYNYYLYSRGHHDKSTFLSGAKKCGFEVDHFVEQDVVHAWWRAVPTKNGYFDVLYIDAAPGSRGAFPVTHVMFYGSDEL